MPAQPFLEDGPLAEGEPDPEWGLQMLVSGHPNTDDALEPLEPPATLPEEHIPPRPVWRGTRRIRRPRPDQPSPPQSAPEHHRESNPALAPTPPPIEPARLILPNSPGLFGPRSPHSPELSPEPSRPSQEPLEQPTLLLEEHIPPRPAWRTVPRSTGRIRKPRPDQPSLPESVPEPLHHCESNPTRVPTPSSTEPVQLTLPDSSGLFGPHTPELASEPPRPLDSWVTWRPNPALAPTPPAIELALLVPGGSPGLFGPRTPELAPEPSRPLHSWITWQPNPLLAPTPPSIEPALLVLPDSPGLFGPRSPRSPHSPELAPEPSRPIDSWITWQPNPPPAPTPPSIEPALLILPDSPGLFGPRSPHSPHSPELAPVEPSRPLGSWSTWQPKPALAPTPPSIEPALLILPDSPGLFGPRSPRSPHSPELAPVEPSRPLDSWSTWQPNPALAPTPPPIEPTLLVPAGSPGLFGPRSPHSSF